MQSRDELIIKDYQIEDFNLPEALELVTQKLREQHGVDLSVKYHEGYTADKERDQGEALQARLADVPLQTLLEYLGALSATELIIQSNSILVTDEDDPAFSPTPEEKQRQAEERRRRIERFRNIIVEEYSVEDVPLSEAIFDRLNEQLTRQKENTISMVIKRGDEGGPMPRVSYNCENCRVDDIITALREQTGVRLEFETHALVLDPREGEDASQRE